MYMYISQEMNPYTNFEYDDNHSDKWQRQRKQRLKDICDLLKKLRTTSYPNFVGKVAVTTGVRSHIIRTYLKEIEDAGLITIRDNIIYWNGQQD
jgi:predicted transcriptional regulator